MATYVGVFFIHQHIVEHTRDSYSEQIRKQFLRLQNIHKKVEQQKAPFCRCLTVYRVFLSHTNSSFGFI